MVLQNTGVISLLDIQTEFGGTNPIGLSEYYSGGAYVSAGTSGVPSSGEISIAQFYGKAKNVEQALYLFQQLTSGAQASCRGFYCLYRASSTYTGPTLNIRRSSDNATTDVYSNSLGTMGLSLDGTGTSFSSWLGGSTAYVTTWYDQSGSGRHATQSNTSIQPIFDLTNMYINFRTSRYFVLPDNTFPAGNSNYTVLSKHGAIDNINGGILGSGNLNLDKQVCAFRRGTSAYVNYWWGLDFTAGTYVAYNTCGWTYNGSQRVFYVNGTQVSSDAASNRNSGTGNNKIGTTFTELSEYLNGELYYLQIFDTPLLQIDRDKSLNYITNAMPSRPIIAVSTQDLYGTANATAISSWGTKLSQASTSAKPVFYTSNGLNNGPYLNMFGKGMILNQAVTMNSGTNGGCTVIFAASYPSNVIISGLPVTFAFLGSQVQDYLYYGYFQNIPVYSGMALNYVTGGRILTQTSASQPLANTWYVFAYRYTNSTLASEIFRTSVSIATLTGATKWTGTGSTAMLNGTYAIGGINRGTATTDSYDGNMLLASMYIYDRSLTDVELLNAINAQFKPIDLSITSLNPYWYYSFNGNLNDSIRNNNAVNNGTAITYSAGVIGACAYLNSNTPSTNAVQHIAASSSVNLYGSMSFSMWINVQGYPDTSHPNVILSMFPFKLYAVNISGVYRFDHNILTNTWFSFTTNYQFTTNTWVHYALTYTETGSGGTARVYINGALDTTYPTTGLTSQHTGWTIGTDGLSRAFKGMVDEFAVFNRVLTNSEITKMATGQYNITGLSYTYTYTNNPVLAGNTTNTTTAWYAAYPGSGYWTGAGNPNWLSESSPNVVNGTKSFELIYYSEPTEDVPCQFAFQCDDSGTLSLNNTQIGVSAAWNPTVFVSASLKNGYNRIVLTCVNGFSAGGVLCSCKRVSDNAVLFITDSSWRMS